MSCTSWRVTLGTQIKLSATNRELYFFNRYTGETAAVKLSEDGNALDSLLDEKGCDEPTLNRLISESETIFRLLVIRKLIEKCK